MLATAFATVAAATMVSRPAAFAKYPSYPAESTRFFVTYQPGGRTKQEAWDTVNHHTPQEEVVSVINGGYFAPDKNPIVAVDLVISKGVERVPYLTSKSRPILAFGNGRVTIFSGKNGAAYAKLKQYQEAGGYYNAIAGDDRPTKPGEAVERCIIGVRDNEFVPIVLKRATWADCKRVIAEQQLDQHLYLDGGSSVYPTKRVPTHIVGLVPKTASNR